MMADGKPRIHPAAEPGERPHSFWVAQKAECFAEVDGSREDLCHGELALLLTNRCLRGTVISGSREGFGGCVAITGVMRSKVVATVAFTFNLADFDDIDPARNKLTLFKGHNAGLVIWECSKANENYIAKGFGRNNKFADLASAIQEARRA